MGQLLLLGFIGLVAAIVFGVVQIEGLENLREAAETIRVHVKV